MATEFQPIRFEIPRGAGQRSFERLVIFSGDINNAGIAIQGYQLDFASKDHHINVVEVNSEITSFVRAQGKIAANIKVTCQYADKNFDDAYQGFVKVVVMADVAS